MPESKPVECPWCGAPGNTGYFCENCTYIIPFQVGPKEIHEYLENKRRWANRLDDEFDRYHGSGGYFSLNE